MVPVYARTAADPPLREICHWTREPLPAQCRCCGDRRCLAVATCLASPHTIARGRCGVGSIGLPNCLHHFHHASALIFPHLLRCVKTPARDTARETPSIARGSLPTPALITALCRDYAAAPTLCPRLRRWWHEVVDLAFPKPSGARARQPALCAGADKAEGSRAPRCLHAVGDVGSERAMQAAHQRDC